MHWDCSSNDLQYLFYNGNKNEVGMEIKGLYM